MSRIRLPHPDDMNDEQRVVYDAIVAGPRGSVVGPLRAALLNPLLADHWQRLGETLRFSTSLPKRLSELAILVTGRRWNAQLEFHIHAAAARSAGLDETIIEDIRATRSPRFVLFDDWVVYQFARELLCVGRVSDALYQEALDHWAEVGVVELTALIGYYSMVAMTLNAHHIGVPPGAPEPLDHNEALTELPPAEAPQIAVRSHA